MHNQSQQTQGVGLKTILKEKGLWMLVLLGILYFYRPLFLGETFFFRDLYSYFFPQKQLLMDFIKMGELPLWNAYSSGGQAYLANIANSTFYPFNLLYFCLSPLKAFNLNIILHLILCSVCAYIFSRVIGFSPISSVIVGVIYGFCGYTLSLVNVLNLLTAMPYLPLLLWSWHLFLLERKRKWFVITIIGGLFQVFVGAPEINIISLLTLLGWTLIYQYPHRSVRRRIVLWLFLVIMIIGMASVQLFPTVEIMLQSSRSHGLSYTGFSDWSLYPGRLPELLVPGFFGYGDTLQDSDYWGLYLLEGRFPYILSMYFGCVTMVLAIVGGLYRGNQGTISFNVRLFLFFLFLLSLMLSWGRFLPFFHILYQYVPLIKLFRYPSKFLAMGTLPLAILVGYIVDIHFRPEAENQGEKKERSSRRKVARSQGRNKGGQSSLCNSATLQPCNSATLQFWIPSLRTLGVLWSVSIIFLMFTIIFLLSTDFANQFQKMVFKQFEGEVARRGLGFSFIHVSAICFLVTLLYHYRRLNGRQWQHWILAGIIIVDLLSAGKRLNPSAPKEFLTDIPEVVQIVRNEIGNGRFFRTENPSQIILHAPSNDVIWRYRWNLEVLNSDLATVYQIPVIFQEDLVKLASDHLIKLQNLVNTLSWEQRLPLLSAGGVTMILTHEDISLSEVERIAEIPNRSNVLFYLYRNKTAAARVEFVTSWESVNSDDEALGVMLNPNYDPRVHVVLQKPESTLFDWPVKILNAQEVASHVSRCDEHAQIDKIASKTHSALFSVSNNCDGYLVFAEPFYPGWRVYVDGKPTPILRANYAFSAVFLKAGDHKVERRYRPNSLVIGAFSSVLFCLLLGVITYKGWL